MIRIDKQMDLKVPYDLNRLGKPERLLFFDIETTGLSAYDSGLYLLGCVYFEDGFWHFHQWLSEGLSDELLILREFGALLAQFDKVVHFNGDTFDMRFLEALAAQYGLPELFKGKESLDLLKIVRKLRRVLGLPDCKLKSVERFLGIFREDRFTGGELIEAYERYLEKREDRLLRMLLLHNEEDIVNLLSILPVLSYADFFTGPDFSVMEAYFSGSASKLFVTARMNFSLPAAFEAVTPEGIKIRVSTEENGGVSDSFDESRETGDDDATARKETSNSRVSFEIPSFYGELRFFYPNPKDYWYLPAEDCAYHKKVASFVDKSHRVPATRENCYTRMEGYFLAAPAGFEGPVFRESFSAEKAYVRYEEEKLPEYLRSVIRGI